MFNAIFAGVDVGGTNTKVGLVDDAGDIIADESFPTDQQRGPDFALGQASRVIEKLLRNAGKDSGHLIAAGVATPGPMDIPNGLVLTPFNMAGWRNFNVRDAFAQLIQKPVVFANDAGAAAFGEYWIGSGREYSSMILITLGTGIGGGIIIEDHSIDGAHSHGAEVGHITVDISKNARLCSCGKRGHLEAYASATALVDRCREALDRGTESSLANRNSKVIPLTALDIANAANDGDSLANEMIFETACFLGQGISSLAHIVDPEAVFLGGAMTFGGSESALGQHFIGVIRQVVKDCALPIIGEHLTIGFASLGAKAGFVGAAGLARRKFGQSVARASA